MKDENRLACGVSYLCEFALTALLYFFSERWGCCQECSPFSTEVRCMVGAFGVMLGVRWLHG